MMSSMPVKCEFTRERLIEDLDHLLKRADEAGHFRCGPGRFYGISSNALVRYAYTKGAMPVDKFPADGSDLMACILAYEMLPEHRQDNDVKIMLRKFAESVKYADINIDVRLKEIFPDWQMKKLENG